jgi:hypothetical protein
MTQKHTPIEIGPYVSQELFVELIHVFAKTDLIKKIVLDQDEQKFLHDFHKHEESFNALTKAIFWDNNLTNELIDAHKDLIDAVDQYGNYPLKIAILLEKYHYALMLLNHEAKIYIEDKIILEINIVNMLQRGDYLFQSVLPHISEENFHEAQVYFSYLIVNLGGTKTIYNFYYRDVINPPIREFGQQLDTISYYHETPSYYGFYGSSLVTMSDHLIHYAKASNNDVMRKIAKAFVNTQNICKIKANYPFKYHYAENLLEVIQSAVNSKNEVALIPGGWPGTAVTLAIVGNNLIFANLGVLAQKVNENDAALLILPIRNIDNINIEFIEQWVTGLACGNEPAKIIASIGKIADYQAPSEVVLPVSPIDNCICVNTKATILGMIYLLVDKNLEMAKMLFKEYQNSLHDFTVNKMIEQLRNPMIFMDHKYECCTLAISYINSNYRSEDEEVIKRIVNLYGALQYIGLIKELPYLLYSKALFVIYEFIRETNKKLAREVVNKQIDSLTFMKFEDEGEDESDGDEQDGA